jgi:hypothetical protein
LKAVQVSIPSADAAEFLKLFQSPKYRKDERDYKWAVHLVLSTLLSSETANRPDFPNLIADVFGSAMPDLMKLGLKPEDQAFVKGAVGAGGGLRGAMGNLGGGKWGLAQFAWFPRAVEFGLGDSLADAFRALVKPDEPLAARVDAFRDQLYTASEALQKKGGYLPDGRSFGCRSHLLRSSSPAMTLRDTRSIRKARFDTPIGDFHQKHRGQTARWVRFTRTSAVSSRRSPKA